MSQLETMARAKHRLRQAGHQYTKNSRFPVGQEQARGGELEAPGEVRKGALFTADIQAPPINSQSLGWAPEIYLQMTPRPGGPPVETSYRQQGIIDMFKQKSGVTRFAFKKHYFCGRMKTEVDQTD